MKSKFKASVIISTYNQPEWLRLVLFSYSRQTEKAFEIIVADDGSDYKTASVINKFKSDNKIALKHVWQEDNGFQKTKILNKAILESESDYLIFTDGDCIAREDFVDAHIGLSLPNHALSGGYFKLTEGISKLLREKYIESQICFSKSWLLENGQPKSFKLNKLTKSKTKADFLNTITTTKATFDGMNVSCWKKDIVAVNGFDERMQYGGEDREVGERMMYNGIKFLQARYSLICLHLYHDRPYKNEESMVNNKAIRLETKSRKSTFTPFGIQK